MKSLTSIKFHQTLICKLTDDSPEVFWLQFSLSPPSSGLEGGFVGWPGLSCRKCRNTTGRHEESSWQVNVDCKKSSEKSSWYTSFGFLG